MPRKKSAEGYVIISTSPDGIGVSRPMTKGELLAAITPDPDEGGDNDYGIQSKHDILTTWPDDGNPNYWEREGKSDSEQILLILEAKMVVPQAKGRWPNVTWSID